MMPPFGGDHAPDGTTAGPADAEASRRIELGSGRVEPAGSRRTLRRSRPKVRQAKPGGMAGAGMSERTFRRRGRRFEEEGEGGSSTAVWAAARAARPPRRRRLRSSGSIARATRASRPSIFTSISCALMVLSGATTASSGRSICPLAMRGLRPSRPRRARPSCGR